MRRLLPALFAIRLLAGGELPKEQCAQDAVKSHDLRTALGLYRELTSESPDRSDYWIWAARLASWTNRYAEAERTYLEIHERWADNVEALVGHIYLCIWRERYGNAEQYLAAAERLAPNDVGVLAVRVRLFRANGSRSAASAAFRMLEASYPSHPETDSVKQELAKFEPRFLATAGSSLDQIIPEHPGLGHWLKLQWSSGRNTLAGGMSSVNRTLEQTTSVSFDFSRRFGAGSWLSVGATEVFASRLTAARDYRAGLARRVNHRFTSGLSISSTRFRQASVLSLSPNVEARLTGRWLGNISYSRAWIRKDNGLNRAQGVSARVSGMIGESIRFSFGAAASTARTTWTTETQLGAQRDRSGFGSLQVRLTNRSSIQFAASRRFAGSSARSLECSIAMTHAW